MIEHLVLGLDGFLGCALLGVAARKERLQWLAAVTLCDTLGSAAAGQGAPGAVAFALAVVGVLAALGLLRRSAVSHAMVPVATSIDNLLGAPESALEAGMWSLLWGSLGLCAAAGLLRLHVRIGRVLPAPRRAGL